MDAIVAHARPHPTAVQGRINRLLTGALAVLVMLLLKHHYSQAGPDQLSWILLPTARLIAWLTPANPVWEAGVGYADFGRGIIVAPACAGVNFLIMAFGLAAFCGLGRLRRFLPLAAWMALSLFGAYLTTLFTNTLRIAVSMVLYRAEIVAAGLTAEDLHRLAGVWLYLIALGLFFRGLQPIIFYFADRFDPPGRQHRVRWSPWLPLGWYLMGAVGVPAVNLVFRQPLPAFGRHCLWVVGASVALWGGVRLIAWLLTRYADRSGVDGKDIDCGG